VNRIVLAVTLLGPALAVAEPAATTDSTAAATAPTPVDTPPVETKPARPKVQRFYVRAGVAYVHPFAKSNPVELADINDGPASLALHDGPIAGSGTAVSSATVPAAIIGYVLPWWHNRVSLETIVGAPFSAKFTATGTLATKSLAPTVLGIPTGVMPLGSQLGEATAAPPAVTAVYPLIDHGAIRPFVGAGVAVLVALNAKATNPVLTANGQPDMSITPAPGLVLQTGLEVHLATRFYARLDFKYIAFMTAHAEVHNIQVQAPDIPLFGSVTVGTAKMSVELNPLIVQGGLGLDF
jgi:outer membrane protein W